MDYAWTCVCVSVDVCIGFFALFLREGACNGFSKQKCFCIH